MRVILLLLPVNYSDLNICHVQSASSWKNLNYSDSQPLEALSKYNVLKYCNSADYSNSSKRSICTPKVIKKKVVLCYEERGVCKPQLCPVKQIIMQRPQYWSLLSVIIVFASAETYASFECLGWHAGIKTTHQQAVL